MALTQRTRQILLGSALAMTLGTVAWQSTQSQDEAAVSVVVPIKSRAAKTAPAQGTTHLALDKLQRADDLDDATLKDAFQAHSWYVAPPPPAVLPPPPPPPPAPPPLPFTYMGSLQEDGKLTVFLTQQDQNYAAKAGDTLDGTYRVDSVEPQRVVFTYLPLNMQQSLATGRMN